MVDDMMPLTLPAPAESIFIANPSIVDAVVHNGSRIVLHGRMPGATDLFVFDDAGEVVLRRRVTVGAGGAPYVTVFRGSARQSYICTPYCAPGLVFGDDPTRMNTLITLSRKRGSLARSHAYQRESDFEDDAEE